MSDSSAQSIKLICQEGRSNKQYLVQLLPDTGGGGWLVKAQYGAIDGALHSADKITTPAPYEEALKEYLKLVKSKVAKGYHEVEGGAGLVGVGGHSKTSLRPQLLNALDEGQITTYLRNNSWCAQEKYDGERRMLVVETDAQDIYGVNRKGERIDLPVVVVQRATELRWAVARGRLVLDGELVGETLRVWDVIERKGADVRALPLEKRLQMLADLLPWKRGALLLTPTARTDKEKQALLETVKQDGREGVVFKDLASPYSVGRPASGGHWLKHKLVAAATVRVSAQNTGKRSVAMEMLDGTRWVGVGNVTIPANHPMPACGAIVEVQYLYVTNVGGSLIQPVYRGARADQDASDCVVTQLKYKNGTHETRKTG